MLTPSPDIYKQFAELMFAVQGESIVVTALTEKRGMQSQRFKKSDDLPNFIAGRQAQSESVFICCGNPVEQWTGPNPPALNQIASNSFAWLDIDFKDLKDVTTEEQGFAHFSKVLQNKILRSKFPPPNLVVASGFGVHAYWFLQSPVAPEIIERINYALAVDFGGDRNVFNRNRVLGFAGTVNFLNPTKIAAGREPVLRTIRGDIRTERHMVGQFRQEEPPRAAAPVSTTKAAAAPTAAAPIVPAAPIINLDDDEHLVKLEPWAKRAIVFGKDPEGLKVWDTRSHMVLAVVCDAIRKGVPDEKISALLRDNEWKFTESVLQKRNLEREVARLIERGHAFVDDPQLAALNEEFHVIKVKGSTVVVSLEEGATEWKEPVFQTLSAFREYQNKYRKTVRTVKDGNKIEQKVPLGDWWVGHEQRSQYKGLVYRPDRDELVVNGHLNLWQGFSVDAIEGKKHLRLVDHMTDNLCDGSTENSEYLIKWAAWCVQKRGERTKVAPILRSTEEGTGKTFFGEKLGYLFGAHSFMISQDAQLDGKFNAHLQSCSLLRAAEAGLAQHGRNPGPLKALVTEPTIRIEPKNVNSYDARNYLNIIFDSNERVVVPTSATARRWFILNVAAYQRLHPEYFDAIKADLESGGFENLLHFLLHEVDLSGFDVRMVPQTDALAEQKAYSRRGMDALIEHLCNAGTLPWRRGGYTNAVETTGDKKGEGFWHWVRENFPDLKGRDVRLLGADLRLWKCVPWDSNGRSGYTFPSLADLRAAFERIHGPIGWDNPNQREWAGAGSPRREEGDDVPF